MDTHDWRLRLLAALLLQIGAACSRHEPNANAPLEAPLSRGIQVVDPGNPRPYFHDFGDIAWGEVVQHKFLLENTSSAPVELLDVQGACACTQLARLEAILPDGQRIEGDPRQTNGMLTVPAGAKAEFLLRVDSSKTTANQNKLEVMRLRTNSPETPYITFEVRLFPRRLFQMTPNSLDLQDCPQSAGKSGVVRIVTGVKGEVARVLGIAQQGKRVHATLEETFSLDEFLWVVSIEVPAGEPLGLLRDEIVLSTTDATGALDSGRLHIDVWARIVPDIMIYPQQLNLGALQANEEKTISAELKALAPGARVRVLAAALEGADLQQLSVDFSPLAPDTEGRSNRWNIEIRTLPPLTLGPMQARLVLTLDDPQYPSVQNSLTGYVR